MMRTRFSRCCFVFLVAIVFVLATAIQTWAGEKGKFRCRGVVVVIKSDSVEIPFDPEQIPAPVAMSLSHGEADGMIFNETGGSFLDKARYQVFYRDDLVGGKSQGYKIFTMPNGSKIYGKYEGEISLGKETGTFTFIGGTGEYKGVRGKGTFVATSVTETLLWDMIEGEYELGK